MIEDVELTRKILELYADEDKWPSQIDGYKIREKFPDETEDRLIAHVVWAADAGMFKGEAYSTFTHTMGTQYGFGYPHGLSKLGSDYVQYARGSVWDKAKEEGRKKGIPLTTSILAKILPTLAEKLMS